MREHINTFWTSIVVLVCIALAATGNEQYVPDGVLRCEPTDMASIWENATEIQQESNSNPTQPEPREEVIDDLSSTPVTSLPAGPASVRQPQLSDRFSTADSFLGAGDSSRLVVLTATWCGPCQTYKANMSGLDVSESFEADVQLIDVDRYPELYRLLRSSNSIPQTVWLEDGQIQRNTGLQSRSWLLGRTGVDSTIVENPVSATTRIVQPQTQMYYRTTARQRRLMRRGRR